VTAENALDVEIEPLTYGYRTLLALPGARAGVATSSPRPSSSLRGVGRKDRGDRRSQSPPLPHIASRSQGAIALDNRRVVGEHAVNLTRVR
jgi:hypothetical protein